MTESTLLAGKLSIVGTPIGNLSDASPRVKETLAAADVILCEDTRVTSKLLSAFDIHVPLQRCDQNIIESQIEPTLERLRAGQRVAFVSDAGMPGISDPGQHLVDAALSEGLATEVIPGPSAVTCALVASGLASDHFFFEGFLPRKHGQIVQRLQQLASIPGTIVLYESPFRVLARCFQPGKWLLLESLLSCTKKWYVTWRLALLSHLLQKRILKASVFWLSRLPRMKSLPLHHRRQKESLSSRLKTQ